MDYNRSDFLIKVVDARPKTNTDKMGNLKDMKSSTSKNDRH